jgi:hypothetical protein
MHCNKEHNMPDEEVEVNFCTLVGIAVQEYGYDDGSDLCFNLMEMGVIGEDTTVEEAAKIVAMHLAQS